MTTGPGIQPTSVILQLSLVSGFCFHVLNIRLKDIHVPPTPFKTGYICIANKNTGCSLSLRGRAPTATLHPNRVPTDGGATGKGEEGQADPSQNRGVLDSTS